ncbi:MAG: hydrogenase formation protein HypD [Coriobacteriia bacterium]|nr:hydrogenase formation protein HypD [Coriobacteriia bacterium]
MLIDGFRDPSLAENLVQRVADTAAVLAEWAQKADGMELKLMEVCGTHTMAIAKHGIRSLLPSNIRLLSGPGCPVCVTANSDIDAIIALSRVENLTIATFGDMLRVPGSSTSLEQRRAEGASVQVVYSPLDALRLAEAQPERQIVFVGVGFETTSPIIAATVQRAAAAELLNFSVLAAFKLVPPALQVLLEDPELALDGLILPGHVSTILGVEAYDFIAEQYNMPAVITGFEPLDILAGIDMLLEQILSRQQGDSLRIGNAYARSVQATGNQQARQSIDTVFQPVDATWRGLGVIPASGLAFRPEFARYDATQRFELDIEPTVEVRGCRCGDVLRGIIVPPECPQFGRACTPTRPLGPCMVSSEGSCAAYYRYNIGGVAGGVGGVGAAGAAGTADATGIAGAAGAATTTSALSPSDCTEPIFPLNT